MTRSTSMIVLLASAVLLGCPQPEPACSPDDEVFAWADADGDGFGTDPIGYTCTLGANQAPNNVDCDDTNPDVNPGAEELCDLVDNDCNGRVDETHPKTPWYPDLDADGYGSFAAAESACLAPGPDFIQVAGDCDDSNAAINPEAAEICNDGIDDDCDGFADDADAGVDPLTYSQFWPDADGDTFGDERMLVEACAAPGPIFVDNGDDCRDTNADVNPDALEICNQIDDDCDGLVDDEDDSTDPSTMREFFADLDGDGFGDANSVILACKADPDSGASTNDLDCNDSDIDENLPQDWTLDNDGDGVGNGVVLAYDCFRPHPDAMPDRYGVDCDDDDPDRYPGNDEVCDDLIDHDCNGSPECCDETREVNFDGRCYYLDGSGGVCDTGYELAPQSILNQIASDFVGLGYYSQVSGNCCIWHADQGVQRQDWGAEGIDCNQPGTFDQPPSMGGSGCTNALNLQNNQLTLCQSQ